MLLACALVAAVACARVPVPNSLHALTARPTSVRAAFEGLRGTGAIASVTTLNDGPAGWAARWQRLGGARTTIDASYFIVEDDVFGVAFLARLYERARAGVTVRLVIDARGSIPMTGGIEGRDYLQELVRGGVEVHVFNPPLSSALRALAEGNLVPVAAGTHNKTLVIDGKTAITGGRNVGAAYFVPITQHPRAFVDLDVILDGAGAAAALTAAFDGELSASASGEVLTELVDLVPRQAELLLVAAGMDAWLRGDVSLLPADQAALELEQHALEALRGPSPSLDDRTRARLRFDELVRYTALWGTSRAVAPVELTAEVRVVSGRSRALDNDDTVNAAVVSSIAGARRRVLIETPYFVLTPRLLKALEDASHRGVALHVLTNSALSSDNDAPQSLFVDAAPELLARIPTLRLFVPKNGQTLHRKRIIIDGDLTLVGTYNFDPFSMHLNSETVVAVWSDTYAANSATDVDRRMALGYEYRVQRDTRGRVNRYPPGHPYARQPVMVFGPRDHIPPERLAALRRTKELLIAVRNMWDFDVVYW